MDKHRVMSYVVPLFVEHQMRIMPRDIQNSVLAQISEYMDFFCEHGELWPLGQPPPCSKLADVVVQAYVGKGPYVLVEPKFYNIQAQPAIGLAMYHTVHHQLCNLPVEDARTLAFFLIYGLHKWKLQRPVIGGNTWDFLNHEGMLAEARQNGWWVPP